MRSDVDVLADWQTTYMDIFSSSRDYLRIFLRNMNTNFGKLRLTLVCNEKKKKTEFSENISRRTLSSLVK